MNGYRKLKARDSERFLTISRRTIIAPKAEGIMEKSLPSARKRKNLVKQAVF